MKTRALSTEQLKSNEIVSYGWESFKTTRTIGFDNEEHTIDFPGILFKPKYIYIVFQHISRINSSTGNMCFDNLNPETINVEVSSHRFFPIHCDFTPTKFVIDDANNAFLEAEFKTVDVDTVTVVTQRAFVSLCSIFCFDVTNMPPNAFENAHASLIQVYVKVQSTPATRYKMSLLYKFERKINVILSDSKNYVCRNIIFFLYKYISYTHYTYQKVNKRSLRLQFLKKKNVKNEFIQELILQIIDYFYFHSNIEIKQG